MSVQMLWEMRHVALVSFLLLVVRPGALSSFLLLEAMHLFLVASCF